MLPIRYYTLEKEVEGLEEYPNIVDACFKIVDSDKLQNDYSSIFVTFNVKIIIHTATDYGRGNVLASRILETNLIFPLLLIINTIITR